MISNNDFINSLERWENELNQSKWSILLTAGVLAAVIWISYGGALSIGYIADDYNLMYAVTSSDFSIMDRFPAGRGTYFRPLVMLSLYFEQHNFIFDLRIAVAIRFE